jgi:type II secretory pathway component PulC
MIKNRRISAFAATAILLLIFIPLFQPRAACQEHKRQQSFPYSLVGIIIPKTGSSQAVLKNDQTGETLFLKIRDRIDGSQIIKISEDRIILQKAESTFQIFLKAKHKKIETRASSCGDSGENNSELQSPFVREMTWPEIKEIIETDLPVLIKESRVIPHIVQGKFQGFKVTQIPKTRFLSDGEIQVNDVIRFINDVELDGFAPLLSLERRLKNERRLSIILERNGQPLQRTWKFRNLAIPEHEKPIR